VYTQDKTSAELKDEIKMFEILQFKLKIPSIESYCKDFQANVEEL
jgi:hypothetical protein